VADVPFARLHRVDAQHPAADRLARPPRDLAGGFVELELIRSVRAPRSAFVSQCSEVRVIAAMGSASQVSTRTSRSGFSTYSWTQNTLCS